MLDHKSSVNLVMIASSARDPKFHYLFVSDRATYKIIQDLRIAQKFSENITEIEGMST